MNLNRGLNSAKETVFPCLIFNIGGDIDMEIGTRLKKAREAKNLSLEDIQDRTKIQTRYLKAIETGDFDAMPGDFYVRAFIKEYAGNVGLDPEQVCKEHENEIPSPAVSVRVPNSVKGTRTRSASSRPSFFSSLPGLLAAVVIIGIIYAIWFFNQNTAGNSTGQHGIPVLYEEGKEVIVNAGVNMAVPVWEKKDTGTSENEGKLVYLLTYSGDEILF